MLSNEKKTSSRIAKLLCIVLWLVFFSIMTIVKYAPEHINADIILHSVVSLQNITVYYWGQNRLLNVVPLLVSFIDEPTYNLCAILLVSSFSFYLAIFVSCTILARTSSEVNYESLKLFAILSSIFILSFNGSAIAEIVFMHVEYSMPALLVGLVLYLMWFGSLLPSWWVLAVAVLLGVAVGMNPSTVVAVLFVVGMAMVFQGRVDKRHTFVAVFSVGWFLIWDLVARWHGNFQYNKFELSQLAEGLNNVVVGIVSAFYLPVLLLLTACSFSYKAYTTAVRSNVDCDKDTVFRFSALAVWIFSIGWLFLFGANEWVKVNEFSRRYFFYVLFGFLVVIGFEIRALLRGVSRKVGWCILVVFVGAGVVSTIRVPLFFSDFEVFDRVDRLVPESHGLYAGDYWIVWPAVLRDLMLGKTSFGLAYRGEGNKAQAVEFISSNIAEDGYFSVLCLEDTVENCTGQIRSLVGPVVAGEVLYLRSGVAELKFFDSVDELSYAGELFTQLPSSAGIVEGHVRKTSDNAGCLFFGPYVPIKEGLYQLSVTGSSRRIMSASIDVASNKGSMVHQRFTVPSMIDGMLLSRANVHVPKEVEDLEIRLCVAEGDELAVSGYKFLRAIR